MQEKPMIEVVLSPALIPFYNISEKTVVVIDILRATTTICEALHNGARSIIPVSTPEEALEYREKGMLAAAERNGIVHDGFELGNSPQSFTKELVSGNEIALTTTNGTKALLLCDSASEIIIGSFFNLQAVAKYLISKRDDVVLVCAGWKDKFNLEDTVFAGAIVKETFGHFEIDSDATATAYQLYLNAEKDLVKYLENCNHARRFAKLGIHDLEYCLELNKTPLLPVYKSGKIICAQQGYSTVGGNPA